MKTISIVITSLLLWMACASKRTISTDSFFELGIAYYNKNKLEPAYENFLKAYDAKRISEKDLWLAETMQRLDKWDSSHAIVASFLENDTCNSFAYTILGDIYNPQYGGWEKKDYDSSQFYLNRAVHCDEKDGNAWLSIWNHAIRLGNDSLEAAAVRKLYKIGFYTDGVLEINRWILKSLPESSLVITNGDFDTYPARSLQEVDSLRRDVMIINYPMLNMDWYLKWVHKKANIPLSFEYDVKKFDKVEPFQKGDSLIALGNDSLVSFWLANISQYTKRPIVFSGTVNPNIGRWNFKRIDRGAYWYFVYADSLLDDMQIIEKIFYENVNIDNLKGPYTKPIDRSPVRRSVSDGFMQQILLQKAFSAIMEFESDNKYKEALNLTEKTIEVTKALKLGSQYLEPLISKRNELKARG